ncbi:MAG: Vitamin B12 dependent methionine synthase activation subunit [Oscillospiraceae bacterium]|jgi:hypothetical protein|nr:Vitamin B12 dependent methionine synthase activation subunit [Oscillospiraceae bacterium]
MENAEILRYLGYRGRPADAAVLEKIEEVKHALERVIAPAHIAGTWDVQIEEDTVFLAGRTFQSHALARHLCGCKQAVLLAATLGTGADTCIRQYTASAMEKAVIAQAVCAARIEQYCDSVTSELSYPTPRFSPGYGDFSLQYQRDILQLLDCAKRIGLTMNDAYMLLPSKSVTALIGLRGGARSDRRGCAQCAKKDCQYARKEG